MISETRFARSYASLWRSLTPTMELFIRKANLRLAERHLHEIGSAADPRRRALINQVAYETLFKAAAFGADSVEEKLSYLDDVGHFESTEMDLIGSPILSDSDELECRNLSKRMCEYLFRWQPLPTTLKPHFPGCGVINACVGDASSGQQRLIELKDGDRPFRAYEFRQLTTYAALNLNSTGRIFPEIQVINSRRGLSITIATDEFANEVAGQSAYDLLSEVVRVISEEGLSR